MKNNYIEQLNNKLKTPMLEDIITLNDVYSHRLLKSILDGSIQSLANDSTSREMIAHAATCSLFYSQSDPDFYRELFCCSTFEKIEELLYDLLKTGKTFDRSMTKTPAIADVFEKIMRSRNK